MMCLLASYKKKIRFFCILKINEERSRIRSWIHFLVRGTDPDPHQNVTDPQH
jgi:hypothetical protein